MVLTFAIWLMLKACSCTWYLLFAKEILMKLCKSEEWAFVQFFNYFHHHTQVLKCFALFIQDEANISLNKETDIELSAIMLTRQRKASEPLLSDEDLYDGREEDESFTTQQLFSFAWQIERGMVRPRFFHIDRRACLIRCSLGKNVNRLFAWPGHMVQNFIYWWASCTVGLLKQR